MGLFHLSGFRSNRSWIYLLLYVAVFITWNDVQVFVQNKALSLLKNLNLPQSYH